MSEPWSVVAEREMLQAEVEALERRLDAARAERSATHAALQDEAARAAVAADVAQAENDRFESLRRLVDSVEGRIAEARRETTLLLHAAEGRRSALADEIAGTRRLLGKLAVIAEAIGDEDLRRWARREMTAPESP